jgi:hypothetical protein
MTKSLAALTAAALAIGAFALAAPAAAQEPEPFIIEFHERLDFILEDWGGIDALVGNTVCASLEYPTEDRHLSVGGAASPPECSQAWRVVALARPGAQGTLSNNLVLQPGETVLVETLMPFPATDGPDLPPFWVEVRAGDGITTEDLLELGSLTTYVGGSFCGTESFDASETAYTVPVGGPGTADGCREIGAEIVLVDGAGRQLAVRPTVVGVGLFYTLEDLTLDPLGRGAPAPGAAGNLGLGSAQRSGTAPALWLLVLIALLAGGRYLTRERLAQSRLR